MNTITHLDGADVIVIDVHGQRVPAVGEVRLEPDRAVVVVRHQEAGAWLEARLHFAPDELMACAICSPDGRVHWQGPVRLACA